MSYSRIEGTTRVAACCQRTTAVGPPSYRGDRLVFRSSELQLFFVVQIITQGLNPLTSACSGSSNQKLSPFSVLTWTVRDMMIDEVETRNHLCAWRSAEAEASMMNGKNCAKDDFRGSQTFYVHSSSKVYNSHQVFCPCSRSWTFFLSATRSYLEADLLSAIEVQQSIPICLDREDGSSSSRFSIGSVPPVRGPSELQQCGYLCS